jgi:hypothetical protein
MNLGAPLLLHLKNGYPISPADLSLFDCLSLDSRRFLLKHPQPHVRSFFFETYPITEQDLILGVSDPEIEVVRTAIRFSQPTPSVFDAFWANSTMLSIQLAQNDVGVVLSLSMHLFGRICLSTESAEFVSRFAAYGATSFLRSRPRTSTSTHRFFLIHLLSHLSFTPSLAESKFFLEDAPHSSDFERTWQRQRAEAEFKLLSFDLPMNTTSRKHTL